MGKLSEDPILRSTMISHIGFITVVLVVAVSGQAPSKGPPCRGGRCIPSDKFKWVYCNQKWKRVTSDNCPSLFNENKPKKKGRNSRITVWLWTGSEANESYLGPGSRCPACKKDNDDTFSYPPTTTLKPKGEEENEKVETGSGKKGRIACVQKEVEEDTCQEITLTKEILKSKQILKLPDKKGTVKQVSIDSSSAVFQGDDSEVIFTWHKDVIFGNAHIGEDTWFLQSCSADEKDCYVWVKQKAIENPLDVVRKRPRINRLEPYSNSKRRALLDQAKNDNTTLVYYSIMIWYTPEFRSTFSSDDDVEAFVDMIFKIHNDGYKNSNMPVRAIKLGVKQHPTLDERAGTGYDLFNKFVDSKKHKETLNCADSAALFILTPSVYCGVAFAPRPFSCSLALSITAKPCALSSNVFGHELGHNFGALHDPKQHPDRSGDGYGHLIESNDGSYGYRTILAYYSPGHSTRVNHYSNPDVFFKGFPTGIKDVSNNARLITANRFAMAECGTDEPDGECLIEKPPQKECAAAINYVGRFGANGRYLKSASLHNGYQWFKHETYNWCIFYARHWKVDSCYFVDNNLDWSQGYVWTKLTPTCPEEVGANWRYYSWSGGSNSGPVDTSISITPEVKSDCANQLQYTGRFAPVGKYVITESLHNGNVWYKHEARDWCIFYARHWKIDTCNFVTNNLNWSQGYVWTKLAPSCPQNVGSNWRYYSWSGGSDSGPIDTSIAVVAR